MSEERHPAGELIIGAMSRLAWHLPPLRQAYWRGLPDSRFRERFMERFFQRGYREFNRSGQVPTVIASPDIVVNQAAELLGTVGEYRGFDGLAEMMGELREAWGEVRFEPIAFKVVDGDRFLVTVNFSGKGTGSGVPVSKPIAHLWFAPNAKRAERLDVFWEPEEALEAAGLSE